MAQVDMPDPVALGSLVFQRSSDGAEGRAPGYDQQIARRIAGGDNIRDLLNDRGHFRGAKENHAFVVERLVVDVAGDVLFLDAADAVLESRRAGNRPWTRERVRIAAVWLKSFGILFEVHGNFGQIQERRNGPGLGTVGEIAVGKN